MDEITTFSKLYSMLIQQDIKAGKKFLTSADDFLRRRTDIKTAIAAVKDILKTEYNINSYN